MRETVHRGIGAPLAKLFGRSGGRLAVSAAAAALLALAGCRGSQAPQPHTIVDLSPALTYDVNLSRLGSQALNFLGTDGRINYAPITPSDPTYAFGIDSVQLHSHTGSHLDAASRLLRGGEHPFQVPLEKLIGNAKVIDLRWHDTRTPIDITDLETTPIDAGDLVVLYTGYMPPVGDKMPDYPPLSPQTAEWFAAKKIRALATDMPALVSLGELQLRMAAKRPPELVWAEYLPLFQAQIPIVLGLVNLDKLVDQPRVQLVVLPLPVTDSGGAPARAAALLY